MSPALIAMIAALSGAEPDLNDLGWLEGCWDGEGFGGQVSECWMRAPNGRLTGMFQMVGEDGKQTFSEIFILDNFEDGPALRLKHFNPDLTGWEEKDDFVVFPLLEAEPGLARFSGLEYWLDETGALIVEVAVHAGGEARTETLRLERAAQAGRAAPR